jgi:subtilisin family serine protease
MSKRQGLRATVARLIRWSAAVALLAVPASAAAAADPSSGLSPRLTELAKPSLRAAPNAVQARAVGLVPAGPGGLLRQGRRVVVYVRFDHGAVAGLPALRAAGGKIVDSSRRYQTVTVAAKPVDLRGIAAVANVAAVTEAHAPFTATSCTPAEAGEILSEGVQQLKAGLETGEARNKFPGVDGSGITVGVLSDSFDSAKEAADGSGPIETDALEDEESGDLPGPKSPCVNKEAVKVLDEFKPEFAGEEAADEGRAMAQIVHDVAPGAKIDFATAFKPSMFGFAENIEKLAKAGADVIADDVFYFEEPFFQDGPVAVAVNEAVEGGTTYFSAAGNDNLVDPEGHEIASWETPEYRDAGSCPAKVADLSGLNASHCLDFDPGKSIDKTFGIKVKAGGVLTIDLQWDEPWNGVKTNLDAFLLDSEGRLLEVEPMNNLATQEPTEILQWINGSSSTRTVQFVINRFAGSNPGPRLKFGLLENGSGVAATEYPRSTGEDVVGPTIFGHSGSASAVSVGAIGFESKSKPEQYSSRGPVRHDFGPVEGVTPAKPISEELSKPDLVATDCGLTTFFADFVPGEGWRFCGTSAAAPHAAGVAALMLDEKSGTPAQVRAAMQASALKVGTFGPCSVGAGLIDAAGAIEDLLSASVPSLEECLPPEPEASVEEAQAPGNWGLEAPPIPPPVTQAPEPEQSKPSLTPPRTFIRLHPRRIIRTHARTVAVVFRFGSNESGVTFSCRVDGGLFRSCPQRLARRFGIGPHTLRVVAFDAGGNGDRTPAVYRFRVKRIS